MFKLSDVTDTYPWTVTIKMPHNGSYKKTTVKVDFNRLPHDERMRLMERIQTTQDVESVEEVENDFFDKVFAGWHAGQVKDENGDDLEVTDDTKRQVLTISEFRQAVIDGYFDSVAGDKLKQKNSMR
ncbi:hypothetical protein [Psychrobacter sp. FDAARGOS_221]|uniref:hypothetical protein n=1 Tax=Psychrobacter sp. FDAARGOS_221 TaxID=1975705 RepID=UPI000BB5421A|nr:hypothetical protein [Psychrobacter sp. FDAARGOS_221]PNK59466.1 hypothetical protein A6J60_000225 [Psychrobacter sp. FDAARGOS_221]PNK59918.1 hypothetical protein A6J60_002835 [Psychrobacter sp. FDAARGOS_221]PNK61465.1 hypothetical protein A6J60_011720 [Psychrobacter sp. FDAARGOS_221]